MKFELETLPNTILLEVFSFFDERKLLEARFLNKYLFNIVQNVIQHYLCYSSYIGTRSFEHVQTDFIKRFSLYIKHLNICTNDPYEYSKISTSVIKQINDIDKPFIYNSFMDRFTSLASIYIKVEKDTSYSIAMNYFKNLLDKVDKVDLTLYNQNINLDSIIAELNPEKLKSLNIDYYYSTLNMNSILKFNQFKHLEHLKLEAYYFEIGSNYLPNSEDIIFPSLKTLRVHGIDGLNSNFTIEMFGNINHLEAIELDLIGFHINCLQYFKQKRNSKLHLIYTPSSMEFGGYPFILETLRPLSEISTSMSLTIRTMVSKSDKDDEVDFPLFLNVNEITFYGCYLTLQYIFNILKYFPNVKKVAFRGGNLRNYRNLPLLFPNNLENFLFCIENGSFYYHLTDDDLHLLDGIRTYIF